VYSGDAEIMKQREWFRQTRVHNTVTLNNENMVITKSKQEKWQTGNKLDVLRYTNPSYANLEHKRTVLFVDQQYFVIIDKVVGSATGNVAAHFQLKEDSKPFIDIKNNRINTTYTDGNNLLIQSLSKDVKLVEEEGKVSYAYQKEVSRPAFRFEKQKADDKSQYFITVLYPYGNDIPKINLKSINYERLKNDEISLTLEINDKEKTIKSNP
ncbi:MAG: heparinase, partial [Chitinophagaceae bacterium]